MNRKVRLCFKTKNFLFIGKCWLHIGTNLTSDPIIPFTTKALEKCVEKSLFRQNNSKRRSKFSDICLPPAADGKVGYHALCYRSFISINTNTKGT